MSPVLVHLSLYIASFFLVWFGAGRVINAISSLAKYWKLPAFTVSFFILGFMTTLPEITIGVTGLTQGDPQIFTGNLLGATLVLFLLIIPLLSLTGKGVSIPVKQINHKELLFILGVSLAPTVFSADNQIAVWEGWVLIALYVALAGTITFQRSVFETLSKSVQKTSSFSLRSILDITAGAVILFFASRQIVSSTLFFADIFQTPTFLVSLIVIALGTNIPEISIIFRSIASKKTDIALADYLGSASANTLVFGILTVIYGRQFTIEADVGLRIWFGLIGLTLFFIFSKTKDRLSRKEALILFSAYISFLIYEVFQSR